MSPLSYSNYLRDPAVRRMRWDAFVRGGMGAGFAPNAGHRAIAELIGAGLADCVITQNVDSLHALAGVPPEKLFELHGSSTFAKCLTCRTRWPREEAIAMPVDDAAGVPLCPVCGGLTKSGGVSFGEPLPPDVWEEAERHSIASDLFVVVGSSLTVHPAARLPRRAVEASARLLIINLDPTPMDRLADLVVREPAAGLLEEAARTGLARQRTQPRPSNAVHLPGD